MQIIPRHPNSECLGLALGGWRASGLGRGGEERRNKTAISRFTNGPVLKPTTRTEQKIKHTLVKNNLRLSKIYLKRCFPLYPTTENLEIKARRYNS